LQWRQCAAPHARHLGRCRVPGIPELNMTEMIYEELDEELRKLLEETYRAQRKERKHYKYHIRISERSDTGDGIRVFCWASADWLGQARLTVCDTYHRTMSGAEEHAKKLAKQYDAEIKHLPTLQQHVNTHLPLQYRHRLNNLTECLDIHGWEHVESPVCCGEKVEKSPEDSSCLGPRRCAPFSLTCLHCGKFVVDMFNYIFFLDGQHFDAFDVKWDEPTYIVGVRSRTSDDISDALRPW
jgi:hypothetical protein